MGIALHSCELLHTNLPDSDGGSEEKERELDQNNVCMRMNSIRAYNEVSIDIKLLNKAELLSRH